MLINIYVAGMSSGNSSPSFHGSPESGVAKESSLVFPQDRPNLSSSPSSTTGSGSPMYVQILESCFLVVLSVFISNSLTNLNFHVVFCSMVGPSIGMDPEYQAKMAIG